MVLAHLKVNNRRSDCHRGVSNGEQGESSSRSAARRGQPAPPAWHAAGKAWGRKGHPHPEQRRSRAESEEKEGQATAGLFGYPGVREGISCGVFAALGAPAQPSSSRSRAGAGSPSAPTASA